MPKPKKKKTESRIPAILAATWQACTPCLTTLAVAAGIAAAGGGAVWALHHGERLLETRREYPDYVEFDLIGVPGDLEEFIRAELVDLHDVSWAEHSLCQRIGERLAACPWVRRINAVGKSTPGRIYVDCVYRQPTAMVHREKYYYLVDEFAVRLPGTYQSSGDLPVVTGVRAAPPEAGEPWRAADLSAGLELSRMFENQPFREQVEAIKVENIDGRNNPRMAHVEILTTLGTKILWGSAPGDEIEENSAAQKMRILHNNYQQYGRIDAQHGTIDISVYPDRFIIIPSQ